MKIYLIHRPDGSIVKPSKRGNCTYVIKGAAINRCSKAPGYHVREYDLEKLAGGTVVHSV